MLVGGRVRGTTVAAAEAWATDALAQTYVEVAFVATNGVSARRGLTTPDLAETAVKRAMIAAARRVVLLADHAKARVDHLVRFGEPADVDTFVPDSGVDERTAARSPCPDRVWSGHDGAGSVPCPVRQPHFVILAG
jgi:DeoR family transcriptional regulator, fructose operon transcriptional repressor